MGADCDLLNKCEGTGQCTDVDVDGVSFFECAASGDAVTCSSDGCLTQECNPDDGECMVTDAREVRISTCSLTHCCVLPPLMAFRPA